MTETAVFDPIEMEQFGGQLLSIYAGSMLSYMIDIGHRTGLFAAAAQGPATSQELADRAGLQRALCPRVARRDGDRGIFDYDPATVTYTLPRVARRDAH